MTTVRHASNMFDGVCALCVFSLRGLLACVMPDVCVLCMLYMCVCVCACVYCLSRAAPGFMIAAWVGSSGRRRAVFCFCVSLSFVFLENDENQTKSY